MKKIDAQEFTAMNAQRFGMTKMLRCLFRHKGPFSMRYFKYQISQKKNKPMEEYSCNVEICLNCTRIIREAHLKKEEKNAK